MKNIHKSLLSALFITSLVPIVPLCGTAINSHDSDQQEKIPTIAKPAHWWNKRTEKEKTAIVLAAGIAGIYVAGYWYNNMNPLEFTRYMKENISSFCKKMGRTLISGGIPPRQLNAQINNFQTINIDIMEKVNTESKILVEKLQEDLALTKAFASDDPNYSYYVKELKEEFRKNITHLYQESGFNPIDLINEVEAFVYKNKFNKTIKK